MPPQKAHEVLLNYDPRATAGHRARRALVQLDLAVNPTNAIPAQRPPIKPPATATLSGRRSWRTHRPLPFRE